MKKILLFALILTATQLGAQNKDAEAALKAYTKAKEDVSGKKAQDATSWVRFGKAVTALYDVPVKNLWIGVTSMEARVLLKDSRSTGSEQKTMGGETYDVTHYADKDLYYTEDGRLAFWIITKPLLPGDMLEEACNAFQKGYELDTKGSLKKEITAGLIELQNRYVTEAMAANALTDYSGSSKSFGNSIRCAEHPAVNKTDTVVVFYAGLTAYYANEYERAVTYVQRAISLDYTQEGTAYSVLADSYKNLEQSDKVEPTLVEGFTKYPSNQSILIALINLYMDSNEDPTKVMEYIRTAQQNEPANASLYYAEGNVWKNLKDQAKAIESFKKSVEVDPQYAFGYYTLGVMYYETALDLQNKANDELDDAKYSDMMAQLEQYLEQAIDPFEQCYAVATDDAIKSDTAMYLQNIYYRLQGKNEAYQAGYEKYKAINGGDN